MNCEKCGKPLDEDAIFCVYCGTRAVQQQSGSICSACGARLEEGALFCVLCGARVAQPTEQVQQQSGSFCSTCGAELEEGALFCMLCGVKVSQPAVQVQQPTVQVQQPQPVNNAVTDSGRLLLSLKAVNKYEGTPSVGWAKASGPLSVYDDRIEFKITVDSAIGNALGLGLINLAVAKNTVKDAPTEIYPVSKIASLRVGKFGAGCKTLVVEMRNGTTVSFCPLSPASFDPQNIINILQPYLR